MKKTILLIVIFSLLLSACGVSKPAATTENASEPETLNIAYQYSLAYAPLILMKERGLIEKHYGKPLKVNWSQLNSGNAIREGIIAGSLDVGAVAFPPVITGVKAGVPFKIFSGISSQPYNLMNNKGYSSLTEITPEDKIVVLSLNSLPHIMLAYAAKAILNDAHALDQNIVAMSNGDGMTALVSGAVACQVSISPYNLKEKEIEGIQAIEIRDEDWPVKDTHVVGVASDKLYSERPELYKALCDALAEAIGIVNEMPDDVLTILARENDTDVETVRGWLENEYCRYSTNVQGLDKMSKFMLDEGFLEADSAPTFKELTFDNVQGN